MAESSPFTGAEGKGAMSLLSPSTGDVSAGVGGVGASAIGSEGGAGGAVGGAAGRAVTGGAVTGGDRWAGRGRPSPLPSPSHRRTPMKKRSSESICRCKASDWVPCSRHITWYGVAHFLSAIGALFVGAFAGLTGYLCYGTMAWPWAVMTVCVIMFFFDVYGSWTHRHASDNHVYAYIALQYGAISLLTTCSLLAVVQIPTAQESVEETWYILQVKVLPFSTMLDVKRQLSQLVKILAWLSSALAVLHLPVLYRMWRHIGGIRRLSFKHLSLPFPIVVFLCPFAALLIAVALDGIHTTAHASDAGPAVLQFACFLGGIVITLSVMTIALLFRSGRSFLGHVISGWASAVVSLMLLLGGSFSLYRGEKVEEFVADHLDLIWQYVNSKYVDEIPDKYIQDSRNAFIFAGATCFILSVHVALMAVVTLSVAYIILSEKLSGISSGSALDGSEPNPSTPRRAGLGYGTMDEEKASPYIPTTGISLRSQSSDIRPAKDTAEEETDGMTTTSSSSSDSDEEDVLEKHAIGARALSPASAGNGRNSPDLDQLPVLHRLRTSSFVERWSVDDQIALEVVESPSFGQFMKASCRALVLLFKQHWAVMAAVLVMTIGVSVSSGVAGDLAHCHAMLDDANATPAVYNISFDITATSPIVIEHSFPHGGVHLRPMGASNIEGLRVTVRGWSKGSFSSRYPNFINSTSSAPGTFVLGTTLKYNPSNFQDAFDNCDAVDVELAWDPSITAFLSLDVYSNSAYVTIDGDPSVATILFVQTKITTHTAPVKVSTLSSYNGVDFHSTHGDWTSDTVFGNGINIETHGLVKMSKSISGSLDPTDAKKVKIAGDVSISTYGSGAISLTQELAGDNVFIRSGDGDIIGVSATLYVRLETELLSFGGGDIYMSTWLQGAGNHTSVYTNGGDVLLASSITNCVDIATTGDVSMLIPFFGISDVNETVFLHPVPNYTDPCVNILGQGGKVYMVNVGASPLDAEGPSKVQMNIQTTSGDIKMEITGGSFHGNYSVAGGGTVTVENVGQIAPHRGIIDNDDGSGRATLNVYSDTGNTDLSFMPSAL